MKEVGYSIKRLVGGDSRISVTDLITDLLDLARDIEEFGKRCEDPKIYPGKGADEKPLEILLLATQQFKSTIKDSEIGRRFGQ